MTQETQSEQMLLKKKNSPNRLVQCRIDINPQCRIDINLQFVKKKTKNQKKHNTREAQ